MLCTYLRFFSEVDALSRTMVYLSGTLQQFYKFLVGLKKQRS